MDENTGCADVVMDPNNPDMLFAGMWQFQIHPWGRFSGGPGSGLFLSRDGGTTWKRLAGNGLPEQAWDASGRRSRGANSKRVYALIETGTASRGRVSRPTAVALAVGRWRRDVAPMTAATT